MTHDKASRSQFGIAGAFTQNGKCGKLPVQDVWPAAAATSLLLFAIAQPAAANPPIGPTSSASVEISLSVAPSFRLASNASAGQERKAAPYCIATNGEQMALPIMLVPANDSEARDSSGGNANPLGWCGRDDGAQVSQARTEDRTRAGLVLIRPE